MFLECEHILWSLRIMANILLTLSMKNCPAKKFIYFLLFLEAKLNSMGRDNLRESF